MKYKDEHFFQMSNQQWPPNLASFVHINFSGMSDRQSEVAMFLDKAFEYDHSAGVPEFVDLNLSLGRLVGSSGGDDAARRKPWSKLIPMLTSSSVILMRWKLTDEYMPNVLLRLLKGKELITVIGWHSDFWKRLAALRSTTTACSPR